ncbi:STAS domain-containing protein [Bounagaea algeriensis]
MAWRGAAAVLAVTGEVDMVTAPRFEEALTSALAKRPAILVVDLEEVEFFASTGLSALMAAHQQAGADTAVRVVATNSAAVRPLRTTALDRTIPIYPSVELAAAED